MTATLTKLALGLSKFGNGDRTSAPRVLKLIEPAGLAIAAVAAAHWNDTSMQSAKSECVDALVKLLGSDAFRKDEEIALSVGEALATYAAAFPTTEASAEAAANEWPADMDEDFARTLTPPGQVCLVVSSLRMPPFHF